MPENLQPESMSTWMRDVERRLAAVERPSRLSTVQYTGVTQPNTFVAVTSATFVTVWEFALSRVVADAVMVASVAQTAAATTAEFRLTMNVTGTPVYTDVASLGAGLERLVIFSWISPAMILGGFGTLVQLQARRVSGAGDVNVYNPRRAFQSPSYEIGAEDNGDPRVVAL